MRSILTLIFACCGISLIGCGSSSVENSSTANSQIVEASFNVEGAPTVGFNIPGMHCSSCAGSICETLEKVPGVVDVKADVASKTATVAIDKNAFDSTKAIDALNEAAFSEATLLAAAIETVNDPLTVVEEETAPAETE